MSSSGRVLQTLQPSGQIPGYTPIPSTFPVVKLQTSSMDGRKKSLGLPPLGQPRQDDGAMRPDAKRTKLDLDQADSLMGACETGIDDGQRTSRPASDFSLFNNHIRQSAGLTATSSGTVQNTAQPALATFFDITSNKAQGTMLDVSRQGHYHQSLKNLGAAAAQHRPLSTASTMDLDAASGGTVGPDTSRACTAPKELQVMHMPYDWVPKRSVRFLSSQRMATCEQVLQMDPRQVGMAQDAFFKGDIEGLSPVARLHASLLSWRFPNCSWDGDTVRALLTAAQAGTGSSNGGSRAGPGGGMGTGAGAGVGALLAQRLAAWRSSLRSVYTQLRTGSCPAFYLVMQGVQPCTVLVCADGTRGFRGGPHALVCQSTKDMRSRLAAADVKFAMPLAPLGRDGKIAQGCIMMKRVENEDDDACGAGGMPGAEESRLSLLGRPGLAPWTSARDHSPESVLVLTGFRAVHGLMTLILNDACGFEAGRQLTGGRDAADLPLLLAPVAFEGATLQRPVLKVRSAPLGAAATTTRLASLSGVDELHERSNMSGLGEGAGSNNCVEVAGPLPPWTLHRCIQAMRDSHQGDLLTQLESEPSCLSLNIDASQLSSADMQPQSEVSLRHCQGQGSGAGTWSTDEAEAVQAASGPLQMRVVKMVTCQPQGSLLVKLS